MNNLPEFLCGIDVAIKKLRPGVKFTLVGSIFSE